MIPSRASSVDVDRSRRRTPAPETPTGEFFSRRLPRAFMARGRRRDASTAVEVFGFGALWRRTSSTPARARPRACRVCGRSTGASSDADADVLLELGCACANAFAHVSCATSRHGGDVRGVARGRALDREWTLSWTCACALCGGRFAASAVRTIAARATGALRATGERAADDTGRRVDDASLDRASDR